MLKTITRKFKPFFVEIKKSRLKIIKSSGLIPLYNFILKSPLKTIIDEEFFDKRNQKLITYLVSELIISIILKLIDGSLRLYHFRHKVNDEMFSQLFNAGTVPHFTTLIYFLKRNVENAHQYLEKIMFRYSIWILKQEIKRNSLKTITIDVDATAASIYGKQEGAEKGYNPEKKNNRCYQMQVWSIRETKSLLKIELRKGSVHCANGFLSDLKILIPELKKLGVKIRWVADSSYENHTAFNYLDSEGVEFIFVQKQRKTIKKAGKWAKNKQNSLKYDSTLKERQLKTDMGTYRQIFIQVDKVYDEDDQLYFLKFSADEFTNVLATNMTVLPEDIYGLYRDHAQVETIIGELKSSFGSVKSHCHIFDVNQSVTQLVGIAYNVKTLYSLQILKYDNRIPDISTIRDEELLTPGYFANHGGKKKFNIASASFKKFSTIYNRVTNFKPVELL
jgi:hypothetical protein